MAIKDTTKAVALSRIMTDVPLSDISKDLDVPYATLLKWKSEAELDEVVMAPEEVTRDVVSRVATEVRGELAEGALEGVTGLTKLNTRVQEVGLKLADRIAVIANFTEDARDVQLLADALTKIQTAFFKTGPAVNILNQTNNMSESGVHTFSNLLRD